MKKNSARFLLFVCMMSFLSFGSATAQKRYVADEVVAVVGNSMVLLSELEETISYIKALRKEQGFTGDRDIRSECLEMLMTQKFLANQARLDSLELSGSNLNTQAEKYLEGIIAERGSIQEVEKFYNKPIFNVRMDIRNRLEEQELASRMKSEVQSKVTVTPSEVERYFRNLHRDSVPIIPEQYVYSQIAKYPPATEEAKLRVRERLLEYRQLIINGKNFAALARLYSLDGSALRGGELDAMPLEGFVSAYSNALESLKPNQISNIVETEFGFHLIQLIEKKGNLYRSRHILLRPEFSIEEQTAATNQLDSLALLIRNGTLKFKDAVVKYSEDPSSRSNEGVVINNLYAENNQMARLASTKFMKEELPVTDYEQIRRLKPGEVSDAFAARDYKGNEMFKIIQLNEVIQTHKATLKEDYMRIEDMALEDKKQKVFNEWLNKKIEQMYVRITEPYRSYAFENKHWVK